MSCRYGPHHHRPVDKRKGLIAHQQDLMSVMFGQAENPERPIPLN